MPIAPDRTWIVAHIRKLAATEQRWGAAAKLLRRADLIEAGHDDCPDPDPPKDK